MPAEVRQDPCLDITPPCRSPPNESSDSIPRQSQDFSAFKNIKVTERSNMQFRAEFFNLTNHTNFQGVGTSYATGSTTFGTITSTRDARVIQMALKFEF